MTSHGYQKTNQHYVMLRAALLACVSCLFISGVASAQSVDAPVDTIAPVIELEEFSQGVADATQVFTVQIAEETKLKDATLYYRRSGQQPYTSEPLTPLGTSGFYTASIETDPTDLRSIEYYVQARDEAGNRTISGYAFDPYQRTLAPAAISRRPASESENMANQGSDASQSDGIRTREPFYKNRWVQVAAGVVTVGILASALSGDDAKDTENVRVNIVLE